MKHNNSYAKELVKLPDFSTQKSRAVEARLGAFIWERAHAPNIRNVITRGICELDNGADFHGQWTKDGMREGKGV